MKVIIIFFIVFILLLIQSGLADIPGIINYQGLLTDTNGIPVDADNYSLMFRIYNTDVGGMALWTENHSSVAIVKGIFNVVLGSITSLNLPFDQQYWLGVTVGAGTELSPRVKFTSAAYSLNARSVADNAVTNSKIASNAVTVDKIQPNVVSSVDGVSNDGENIDLIQQNTIIITPNDNANTITIGENHSAKTNNPHNVTAAQTGALVSVEGVSNPGGNIDLVPGSNININHNDSANTITISSNTWGLNGNSGTTPGTNFLGTTSNVALELKVYSTRALRLEPTSTTINIIGGYYGNSVTSGVNGAVIGGGGVYGSLNCVTDSFGTIGGGLSNQAGNNAGTIEDRTCATVGGGAGNKATGYASTISGGVRNEATESSSTVPGGADNLAAGQYSFAAGRRAKANHNGSFVWGDSTASDFASTMSNQFRVRASGGVYLYTNSGLTTGMYLSGGGAGWNVVSDSTIKDNIRPVDGREILNKLNSIPISQWNYKTQDPFIEHIGPMAQDFQKTFGLGEDDKSINSIDSDGVALAAIQGLYDIVKEKNKKIAEQESRIGQLEERLRVLETLILQNTQE